MRTLLAVGEFGSFARAAAHIGRSESAVSLQLKRLDEVIGHPLFRRNGRKVVLTEVGEKLLGQAQRLVDLNDEILAETSGSEIKGTLRLGVPLDFANTWLPATLVRLAHRYPMVRIVTTIDGSARLVRQVKRGDLDLTLSVTSQLPRGVVWSIEMPMCWIGPRDFLGNNGMRPLKLVVFDRPCFFRAAATAALDAAGVTWRITFTSPNLAGLWAAVGANLGITVRAPVGLPSQLISLGNVADLPSLPSVFIALITRDGLVGGATATQVSDVIIETIEATIDGAY